MIPKLFILKAKAKLWFYLVSYTRVKRVYPYIYRSYWHYLFHKKNTKTLNSSCYYSARPHPGAGIGHQMANWIAGFWFSKQFGLNFAHIPFVHDTWENFLGFGQDEIMADELINSGYIVRKLPLFDEKKKEEVELNKLIINSYAGEKVVFLAEQDQYYSDQFGVMNEIKDKFYSAKARKGDKLIYSKEYYNIAIHVRRGDIVIGQENHDPGLLMRWQNNDYFANVLSNVLKTKTTEKPIAIYLFSQGLEKDFEDFKHFPNIHFCLEMGAQDSFLHMVYADLLITSKSSFSYKPALLSNGIKVCPKDFWHGYPESKDWILVENDGSFVINALQR